MDKNTDINTHYKSLLQVICQYHTMTQNSMRHTHSLLHRGDFSQTLLRTWITSIDSKRRNDGLRRKNSVVLYSTASVRVSVCIQERASSKMVWAIGTMGSMVTSSHGLMSYTCKCLLMTSLCSLPRTCVQCGCLCVHRQELCHRLLCNPLRSAHWTHIIVSLTNNTKDYCRKRTKNQSFLLRQLLLLLSVCCDVCCLCSITKQSLT